VPSSCINALSQQGEAPPAQEEHEKSSETDSEDQERAADTEQPRVRSERQTEETARFIPAIAAVPTGGRELHAVDPCDLRVFSHWPQRRRANVTAALAIGKQAEGVGGQARPGFGTAHLLLDLDAPHRLRAGRPLRVVEVGELWQCEARGDVCALEGPALGASTPQPLRVLVDDVAGLLPPDVPIVVRRRLAARGVPLAQVPVRTQRLPARRNARVRIRHHAPPSSSSSGSAAPDDARTLAVKIAARSATPSRLRHELPEARVLIATSPGITILPHRRRRYGSDETD
jgi:hypothetical protein